MQAHHVAMDASPATAEDTAADVWLHGASSCISSCIMQFIMHHAFHHASCVSSCIMHFIMHHALHHAFHPRACPFSCLPRKPPGSRWSYTRISCRVTCEADNTSVKRCTLSTLKDSGEGSFCLLREGRVWGCRHGATRLAAAGTGPAAHHVCSRAVHCAHQSSAVRLPAEWREDLAG